MSKSGPSSPNQLCDFSEDPNQYCKKLYSFVILGGGGLDPCPLLDPHMESIISILETSLQYKQALFFSR